MAIDNSAIARGACTGPARTRSSPVAKTTPATIALARTGSTFTLHSYDYDPDAARVGLQAADALGEDPARVLKTLMVLVDDRPACVVLPSDRELNMKAVARIFGGKTARMMPPADAERMTGYKVGGISPFGQKRKAPTAVDASIAAFDLVYVNGGQRGLQIRLAPKDLAATLGATIAELLA